MNSDSQLLTTNQVGRYCINLGNGVYYNTLKHQRLGQDQLQTQGMLAGQEREALLAAVLTTVPAFVTLIPSWECNLRCPQCYVAHLLKRPSGNRYGNLDPDAVSAFIEKVQAHPGWGISGYCFVGGEPLLHPELIRAFQKRLPHSYTLTTNGVWEWDEVADLLADPKLGVLTFSIDGLPEDHNRIRRSLDRLDDVFGVVYRNLARAVKAFPKKVIVVQGSVVDRPYSDKDCERYLALMLLAGVKPENIRLGVAAPSRLKAASAAFKAMVSTAVRFKPCCDYQAGKQLVIVGNHVYPSYYEIDRAKPLGTLADDPETILIAQRTHILETMPILYDEVCRDKCRAVGICWGLCSASEESFPVGDGCVGEATCKRRVRPSLACDRATKERAVGQVATNDLTPLETLSILKRLSLPSSDHKPLAANLEKAHGDCY